MPKLPKTRENESDSLNGWQHQGRRVHALPEELNLWLGRESAGEPVQIASESTDLSSELKRGLSYVRK
jgi:hypothetical protein